MAVQDTQLEALVARAYLENLLASPLLLNPLTSAAFAGLIGNRADVSPAAGRQRAA